MDVTAFTPAKPGQTGTVRAVREGDGTPLSGDVEIRCEGARVDIRANQRGNLLGDKEFERGVFLGVTGRAGLEVVREGRDATGEVRRKNAEAAPAEEAPLDRPPLAGAESPRVAAPVTAAVLEVQMEAVRGFASVLDFDADLSAGGVLPVHVLIRNQTRRAYDFQPSDIVLTVAGGRTRVQQLSPTEAYARISSENSGTTAEQQSLGDLTAARTLLAQKALGGGRLAPGAKIEGFVYFPLGDYDRARLSMTDVATGEAELFVVDF